jgi:Fe-S cluster assembly scaffold protein SufB
MKGEPEWMLDIRLKAYHHFLEPHARPGGLTSRASTSATSTTTSSPPARQEDNWDDVPDIKDTFDKLGIPEAERKFLAGVGAQYESEVVYHNAQERAGGKGVIFLDMDDGLREHPEIWCASTSATIIPRQRQQVCRAEHGRLVGRQLHLRAAGRPHGHAVAGLLPHQRQEHGPVRAHADHR